ncbi:MAG: CoA transferase, partial [Chloroflexi bacterium]|nr:CoA transferase [Chloroflexota bacterium]
HHSQAYLHAGGQAAVGALLALRHRLMTGEGQHVDVSIQESVVRVTHWSTATWDMMKAIEPRGGQTPGSATNITRMWPCQDGYVAWAYSAGANGNRYSLPFVKWMEEVGMADDFLKGINWETLNLYELPQDVIDRMAEPTARFFLRYTKAELLEGAVKRGVRLNPVFTTKDVLASVQLAARQFWVEVEHPELGTTITYPGAFAKASETPPRIWRRAPLIGEHNQEIYQEESGTTRQAEASPGKLQGKSQRQNPKKKLLEGIKVADFGWLVAGPLTTKTLSDYGAEVIRIEGKTRFDPGRLSVMFKDGISGLNRSGTFSQWNTSKLSVALNLAHPKGVAVAKRLVAWADVVVENLAGGVLKRMGLGYEELKKIKPDIIMLSSCLQGQTGPHTNQSGVGSLLAALAGLRHIAGWPDRPPIEIGVYTDFIVPHFSALLILSALDYRRRSGHGQYFDLSQYESSIPFMTPPILDYVVNRRVAMRMGNRYPDAAPHSAYRCRGQDRWCAIAVFTDEEWQSFSRVIGNPAWVKKSKFRTLPARKENEDELDRLVEAWTINHSAEEVMTIMQAAGVAAGVVQTGEDLLEHDPQLKHRRFFWELDHPEIGSYHALGPAFKLSKSPCELRPAPLLGEHNEYVLKQILNLSDDEIAELVIEGVVE